MSEEILKSTHKQNKTKKCKKEQKRLNDNINIRNKAMKKLTKEEIKVLNFNKDKFL